MEAKQIEYGYSYFCMFDNKFEEFFSSEGYLHLSVFQYYCLLN